MFSGSLGSFGDILNLLKREGGYQQLMALPSTGNEAVDTMLQIVKHASDYANQGPSLKRPAIKAEEGTPQKVSKMEASGSSAETFSANGSTRTGTTSSGNSLPTIGSMRCYSTMHISKFRLPFRGIINIPECDVYKTRQQFDEQDKVFLLDTFTMAPFMYSRTTSGTGYWNYDIANIIFAHFSMWRPKRVSYKLSHFKSTTTRISSIGGTNRNISIGNPEGRICLATDSLSQVLNLQFSSDRAGMTIDEFVTNSVYTCGVQMPANNFGNPFYLSDVQWMNEQSTWEYTYDFNDIFMGKYWIRRFTNIDTYHLNQWMQLNIPLIPGNNTSGNLSNNTTYEGVAGDTFTYPNQANQNSPVMLFCPRTGEYTEDESNPRLAATCVVDAYLDIECALYPFEQMNGVSSGWQENESQWFIKYEVPRRTNTSTPFPTYTHWFYNLPPVVK